MVDAKKVVELSAFGIETAAQHTVKTWMELPRNKFDYWTQSVQKFIGMGQGVEI